MKNLFFFRLACLALLSSFLLSSCNKWEDDVNDLKKRVEALERAQAQANDNISAMQQLVSAFQAADYITEVTPLVENGVDKGYTIKFKQRAPITVYHGNAPRISVRQDVDLSWYWTYNDSWLYDGNNNKILATGVTPRLRIENGRWMVSMDNGFSWSNAGQATGTDGQNGRDGVDGANGQDGRDGVDGSNSIITNVEEDENTCTFTFSNGQKATFYKYKPNSGNGGEEPFEDRELTATDIPDQAFREWLLIMHDANKDGKLMLSEIKDVTSIDVPNKNSYYHIYSLEGIQHFPSLSHLYCKNQMISSLNLTNMSQLSHFDCEYNESLIEVIVANNPSLSYFYVENNQSLTSITISNNTYKYFSSVRIYNNINLSTLIVTNNPTLNSLDAYENKLTSLTLENNPNLNYLNIRKNSLTSLDISNLTSLKRLDCSNNPLTTLTFGKLPYLREIDCEKNQLTELDISKCLAVGKLTANNMPTLQKVYVWNSFDTSNPPADFKVNAGVVFERKP